MFKLVQFVGTGLIFLKLILFFEFGLKLVLIISIYSIKYRQFIMNECMVHTIFDSVKIKNLIKNLFRLKCQ